jgi:hypothetical protein
MWSLRSARNDMKAKLLKRYKNTECYNIEVNWWYCYSIVETVHIDVKTIYTLINYTTEHQSAVMLHIYHRDI